MTEKALLRNAVTVLLMTAILVIPLSLSVSGQGTAVTQVFFSNEVYIIPGASGGICTYAVIGPGWVGLDAGSIFAGSVSSDSSEGLAFAIMSTNQYIGFVAEDINKGLELNPGANPTLSSQVDGTMLRHTCTDLNGSYMYHTQGQSFQFQWTLPARDAYYFVILNPGSASTRLAFSLNLITTGSGPPGWSRTGFTNSLASSYQFPSATQNPAGTATNTSSSMISPPSFSFGSMYLVIGLGVVVLVALLLWLARSSYVRKSGAERGVSSGSQQSVQITKEVQRQFCLNCGRQIPVGSRFCGKCGAAQTPV